MSEKKVEERYRRASRNWGSIAVHPTDLAQRYDELSADRQGHVTNAQGTKRSRTTALAHIREGIDGLVSNGYYPTEVGTIVASQIALQCGGSDPQAEAEAESLKTQVNSVVEDAIATLNKLKMA